MSLLATTSTLRVLRSNDGTMKIALALRRIVLQEDINFLLTNRVPRLLLSRLMGRVSRIENRWFARLSINLWRLFTDLDLSDAQQSRFDSLHACFTRELKPGARVIDPAPEHIVSPCDGIVGACGQMDGTVVFQAKGFPYRLEELIPDVALAAGFAGGSYVTIRLTSAMYHRFHAPHDLVVDHVTHLAGDTWNVNPIALRRIERLFCRNERAAISCRLEGTDTPLLLVPVAAILVASLRLHFVPVHVHPRYRGPSHIRCNVRLEKGAEMGWFEHGSTILVFAPPGVSLAAGIGEGSRIRMGQALLRLPHANSFDGNPK